MLMRGAAPRRAVISGQGLEAMLHAAEPTRWYRDLLIRLIEAGYQRQVLVGGDLARRSDLSSYTGGPGLAYIAGKWLPRFRLELEW